MNRISSLLRGAGDRAQGLTAGALALAGPLVFIVLPATASAAAPPTLWQAPVAGPASGPAAGQLANPRGVAVDPASGNVFVAERGNARISEFTPWGEFVKAFGWKVNASAPAEALQVCTAETGCQAGVKGGGSGQLGNAHGIALGENGNLYVFDIMNRRVTIFEPDGSFVLTFGAEVNKTKVETLASEAQQNRCPVDPGDVCKAGVLGTGPGEFSSGDEGDYVDAGPGGSIYVGDVGRIQKFDEAGNFLGEIEGEAAGGIIDALEVDEDGNPYVVLNTGTVQDVQGPLLKLGPAGEKLQAYEAANPNFDPRFAIALGASGNLYAVNDPGGNSFGTVPLEPRVVQFDAAGDKVLPSEAEEEAELQEPPVAPFPFGQVQEMLDFSAPTSITGLATTSACGVDGEDLLASYANGSQSLLRAYGPTPDPALCPPPEAPPSITDQFATSVDEDGATLKAKINSNFWPTTTYFVQYGTGKCSEGGCTEEQPAPPLPLGSKTNLAVTTPGVLLPELSPDTTYHYRFVARTVFEGASGDEVEVRGVGGEVGLDGAEGTFTTPDAALAVKTDCPNQQFRFGTSTHLPECRAYELVSPLDKDGGDIVALPDPANNLGFTARLTQAASSGERMTYSSYRSFGDPKAAPYTSQYLSGRSSDGWSTQSISPGRGRPLWSNPVFTLENEYKAFSEDLCDGYMRLEFEAEPELDPAEVKGFPNFYRRDNCGPGSAFEALTTVAPPNQEVDLYSPELQGISGDGRCTVFRAQDSLTPEAPFLGETETVLYQRCDGILRLVAVLPDGSAAPTGSSAGTTSSSAGEEFRQHRFTQLEGAVSEDASRVYWTASDSGPGKLYLRLNADEDPTASGVCEESEPQGACTIGVSAGSARFWFGSKDGSRALFTEGEELFEFVLNEEGTIPAGEVTLIAEGVKGMLGASDDAKRAYFASTEQIGGKGVAGQPNLYYRDTEAEGEAVFIGTLAETDVGPNAQTKVAISPEPAHRAARVTPDGLHAAFMTPAPLTGYDNTDQANGKADAEVFLYDAGAERLICASCDPSEARPLGRDVGEEIAEVWAAATIPTYDTDLYASRPLSEDGERLFFNSFGPLVNRDTNGKADVYEWQSADSEADCEKAGAERYVESAAGCLSLISSGESKLDSEFIDASASGKDVFFATAASLLSQDPGLIDIYDARSGGGFAPPPSPAPECEGQACQGSFTAPSDPTPASIGFRGEQSAAQKPKPRRRCAKGKTRRKGRCVARKRNVRRHKSKRSQHTKTDRRNSQ